MAPPSRIKLIHEVDCFWIKDSSQLLSYISGMIHGLSESHSSCRINYASISHCREVNAIRACIVLKYVERTKIILHNAKLRLYSVCRSKVILKLSR